MPLYLTEADVDALGDMELALKTVEGRLTGRAGGWPGMLGGGGRRFRPGR